MIRPPPSSTPFPYTTFFRSDQPIPPQRVRQLQPHVPTKLDLASVPRLPDIVLPDRKRTRLHSTHANISHAVFCLKKQTLLMTEDGQVRTRGLEPVGGGGGTG